MTRRSSDQCGQQSQSEQESQKRSQKQEKVNNLPFLIFI